MFITACSVLTSEATQRITMCLQTVQNLTARRMGKLMYKIESIARPWCILTAMLVALTAGCATTNSENAKRRVDAEERLRNLKCPDDTTPACIHRIGPQVQCFCGDRDELERFLELEE